MSSRSLGSADAYKPLFNHPIHRLCLVLTSSSLVYNPFTMSSPEDLRDHDGSFDSDGEHDLTSNGILEVVRNDTEHFEPRRAFDHECSSPSPPPHEGGNRFFLGSNSADGTDEAFSPVMPDISISHADDQSFDYSRSGRDSFASDVPSVLQARGQHDPFATPVDEVPPTIRHFGSFGTLSGIYNGMCQFTI